MTLREIIAISPAALDYPLVVQTAPGEYQNVTGVRMLNPVSAPTLVICAPPKRKRSKA